MLDVRCAFIPHCKLKKRKKDLTFSDVKMMYIKRHCDVTTCEKESIVSARFDVTMTFKLRQFDVKSKILFTTVRNRDLTLE